VGIRETLAGFQSPPEGDSLRGSTFTMPRKRLLISGCDPSVGAPNTRSLRGGWRTVGVADG
jgi:hypothetical protein